MDDFITSPDQVRIHRHVTGAGETALVFVHGWLGNTAWWRAARAHFEDRYVVAALDLAGHGRSDRSRTAWSAERYADDIAAAVASIEARDVVLVGHSMSGAYVLEAAARIPRTRAIVTIDTLKQLDQVMTIDQAERLFALYRADFRSAVEHVLPQHLFSTATPPAIRAQLQREFLAYDAHLAIQIIEPLYRMDVRAAARRVAVPVRAINADLSPTHEAANRAYFRDYEVVEMGATGHYPMLERPDAFNRILDGVLDRLRR